MYYPSQKKRKKQKTKKITITSPYYNCRNKFSRLIKPLETNFLKDSFKCPNNFLLLGIWISMSLSSIEDNKFLKIPISSSASTILWSANLVINSFTISLRGLRGRAVACSLTDLQLPGSNPGLRLGDVSFILSSHFPRSLLSRYDLSCWKGRKTSQTHTHLLGLCVLLQHISWLYRTGKKPVTGHNALLFSISDWGSFTCTIIQPWWHLPRSLVNQSGALAGEASNPEEDIPPFSIMVKMESSPTRNRSPTLVHNMLNMRQTS